MRVNLFRGAFLCVILLATLCVGCLPQPKPESVEYITVLTYNTHLFEGSRDELGGLRRKEILDDKKRAEKMLYKIVESRADIVALQEVWADGNQVWFCQNLKSVYPYCHVSGQKEDWEDFKKTGYLNTCGLVLLSKYKFEGKPDFFEYEQSRKKFIFGGYDRKKKKIVFEEERLARKGGILATIELEPGGPKLRLGITHSHYGRGQEELNAQELANATIIENGNVIDSPAIIMGDFNIHAIGDKGSYGRLKGNFAKLHAVDAYREVHPCDNEERMSEADYTIDGQKNELHKKFFPPTKKHPEIVRDRIDYIFVKKSGGGLELTPVEAEVIHDWKYEAVWKKRGKVLADLSDHYPVKVKFKATRTTTP
jgi:endonuclease/exonuclease/phosphatase family metal-dependent hydrolase